MGVVLVALLLVAGLAVGAVVVLGGDDSGELATGASDVAEQARGRATLATAVADGDIEAIAEAAEAQPDLADDATEATLDEEVTAPVEGGLAVIAFEAAAGEGYTVTATGDGELTSALVPPDGGTVVSPVDAVDATASGRHLLLVAPADGGGDEVAVTVRAIEVVDIDVSVGDAVDGEIAAAGEAIEYRLPATAGGHYLVELDDVDLTLTVLDPEGAVVATELDEVIGAPRFVAAVGGDHRLRVSGGLDGATGAFSIEVTEVPEFYFYYGESGDELYLPTTTEQFSAPIDEDEQRAHFCLFLREGVSMDLDIRVTSATLDMGIDVFDETESGGLIARVNEYGPGESELWDVTARVDVVRCFQLWAVNYTAGSFIVDFTTSS